MSVATAIRNPRSFVAGKWYTTKTVLFDPETFFADLDTSARLWDEILVVAIVGLAGAVGSYFAGQQIMSNISAGPQIGEVEGGLGVSGDVALQIQAFALQPLVGAILLWLALATALYGVSWLYSNRGGYYEFVKHSAWALVPMFIGNVIKSIALVATSYNAWDRGVIEATQSDMIQTAEQVRAFLWTQILGEPIALAGIVIAALFFAWSGYIASFAVAKVRDIPQENAYQVAGVAVVGYLLWVVYDILGIVGVL
jgi:hypothetical protein